MFDADADKVISLALSRLKTGELGELGRLVDASIKNSREFLENSALIQLLKNSQYSTAYKTLGLMVNRNWRAISVNANPVQRAVLLKKLVLLREMIASRMLAAPESEFVNCATSNNDITPPNCPDGMSLDNAIKYVYESSVSRSPVKEEIDIWKNNIANGLPFHEFFLLMLLGDESKRVAKSKSLLHNKSDGEIVQVIYELVHGRGCKAWEMRAWAEKLESGLLKRSELLAAIFNAAVKYNESDAATAVHDGLSCQIMGTSRFVTVDDWMKKKASLTSSDEARKDNRYLNRFYIKSEPRYLVSAIASLYRGGGFIEQFMDNITGQSCFDDYCELIIVDADSPENEFETIKRYLSKHKGINYIRMNYRIGIYDAWNVGAKAAKGDYLTNTNLDDMRRYDSLELQAAALDNLSFADIVYQDLYYTFDHRLSFEDIAAFGYETNLPVITPYNMMEYNSPHNAPMWRKRLHDEVGYFNTNYKSAGDYEFWLRCLTAGKIFYKLNDPHVIYYQNPNGLSTRPDTRGIVEAKEIHKTYGKNLVSKNLVMPFQEFCESNFSNSPAVLDSDTQDRYFHTQLALRNLARTKKYQIGGGNHI